MARQFNQIPPICEQAEYHMFQREKVEVQLPDLFQKIGEPLRSSLSWSLAFLTINPQSMYDRQSVRNV